MKKRSIVIASVLKPMDDTRMTEKMGLSLLKSGIWDVHIIGYGDHEPAASGIQFHALGQFARLSITRMLTPWRVLAKLVIIRPEVVIITTHELLWVVAVSRLLFRTKSYYDVLENYKLNILHTHAFPLVWRWPIAVYVRFKEWLFSFFITKFILAEKNYANELSFISNRFTIIENKSAFTATRLRKPIGSNIHFLFSGTLDTSTGVFEAIELVKRIHSHSPNCQLTVIGYAALPHVRKSIQQEIMSNSFIKGIGIDSLVPHKDILRAIEDADVGIVYYQPALHTQHCIPTKLYEYMAFQLPIIYDGSASWAAWVGQCQAGIAITMRNPDVLSILTSIRAFPFYTNPPEGVTWASEEVKLFQAIH